MAERQSGEDEKSTERNHCHSAAEDLRRLCGGSLECCQCPEVPSTETGRKSGTDVHIRHTPLRATQDHTSILSQRESQAKTPAHQRQSKARASNNMATENSSPNERVASNVSASGHDITKLKKDTATLAKVRVGAMESE